MTYRDEKETLRHRVEELEARLALREAADTEEDAAVDALRQEREELERRVAEQAKQLAKMRRPRVVIDPAARVPVGLMVGLTLGTGLALLLAAPAPQLLLIWGAGVIGGLVGWALRPKAPPPKKPSKEPRKKARKLRRRVARETEVHEVATRARAQGKRRGRRR